MGKKIKSQHVVVIGGGLTSAQIVDLTIGKGVHKVFLICRSHFKLKDFDFPLSWIGKFKVSVHRHPIVKPLSLTALNGRT